MKLKQTSKIYCNVFLYGGSPFDIVLLVMFLSLREILEIRY